MLSITEVSDWAKEQALNALAPLFESLASMVYQWRLSHKGYVPLELVGPCACLGFGTTCGEIHIDVIDDNGETIGFMLKLRESTDQGWAGMYHIAGSMTYMGDTPERLMGRIWREMYGDKPVPANINPQVIGLVTQHEAPRRADATTVQWYVQMTQAQVAEFKEGWEMFTDMTDKRIIAEHQNTLRWFSDPNRKFWARIDGGLPAAPASSI